MKNIHKGLVGFIVILMVVSCSKKETTPPTAGETNSALLAGAKGSSFNWKLTQMQGSVNGGVAQDMQQLLKATFPTCELDNIFQFSRDASQSFTQTEGSTSCTQGDPNTIESGAWAFTDDGKTLLIDGKVSVTETQVELPEEPFIGFMILSGQLLKVNSITSTSLSLSYSYTSTSNAYVTITLTFAKS
jgi:hypothetical protein